ncbi:hypothetical protein HF862_04790 [Fusobacterium sp. FSA-380-WT-3A]|nr:hypothetical protein [Fusobacterium sp. FSA-380-WT-3A]
MKFLKNFKIVFIYIIFLLIFLGFVKFSNISLQNFYTTLIPYFGIFYYLLIITIFADILFCFNKSKIKRTVYRIRLIFFNIFLLTFIFLIVLGYTKVTAELTPYHLLFISLNTFHLGYMFTELILYLFEKFDFVILLGVAFSILLSSLFISSAGIISLFIKKRKIESLHIANLEKKKADIQTRIDIKEALINEEEDEYIKYNQAQDMAIKEQLERARKENFKI